MHSHVHYDTGNIAMFQHAEHWVPVMGKRIQNIHLKKFTKQGTDFSLETFRPLLDGTIIWPALPEEVEQINYRGYLNLTFEHFHPYPPTTPRRSSGKPAIRWIESRAENERPHTSCGQLRLAQSSGCPP